MRIDLRIERLVLDGLRLNAAERAILQGALEGELGRLFGAGGLAPALRSGGAQPSLPAATVSVAPGADPATTGRAIAAAVYGAVGAGGEAAR